MRSLVAVLLTLALPVTCFADVTPTSQPAAIVNTAARLQTTAEKKAIDYLLAHQAPDGSWMGKIGPAVTALVIKALVQAGKPADDPAIKKGLDFIETFKQPDGAYFQQIQPNYNTSCVLSMFAALPEPLHTQYQERITKAQNYLKSLQQVEGKTDSKGKPITKDNPWYGGAGYGEDRPDLSNTAFFIEALRDSGVPANDPSIQKAMVFVTRCQLNGATNAMDFAKGTDDGGFIYTCVEGGESKFGDEDKLEGGAVLRTYGSMTYAGVKSMIYAGLTKDDPRVKAATKWIKEYWTLEDNPGTGGAMGLYYYLHTFGKTMQLYGEDTITDSKGVAHDWRAELIDQLSKSQNPDGSWVNKKSGRWFEGIPLLVTTYGTLALQEARK
jgi:squalene-hopene/tetraprenyl-beta-curcumene cyclase